MKTIILFILYVLVSVIVVPAIITFVYSNKDTINYEADSNAILTYGSFIS